jgi:hypothetical protein
MFYWYYFVETTNVKCAKWLQFIFARICKPSYLFEYFTNGGGNPEDQYYVSLTCKS